MASHFRFEVDTCLLNYRINQEIASEWKWLLIVIKKAAEVVLKRNHHLDRWIPFDDFPCDNIVLIYVIWCFFMVKHVTVVISSPWSCFHVLIIHLGVRILVTEMVLRLHYLYIENCYTGEMAFNSLWPSDAIWRHRCWSTLPQEIAPSHYLNQCEGNFTRDAPAINHENQFQFA